MLAKRTAGRNQTGIISDVMGKNQSYGELKICLGD